GPPLAVAPATCREDVTMPRSWSAKRERQYEHIKDSARKKGRSTKRAKEIAAATVNKQRSQSGETRSSKSKSGSSRKRGGSPRRGTSQASARGRSRTGDRSSSGGSRSRSRTRNSRSRSSTT